MSQPWNNQSLLHHPLPNLRAGKVHDRHDDNDKRDGGASRAVPHEWEIFDVDQDLPPAGKPTIVAERMLMSH